MKPAIFLPDALAARIDHVARENGMNRSEFFQHAGERYVNELEARSRIAQINEAVEFVGSLPASHAAARASIDAGGWEW
ncbi:MAG: ribbon-helix-helix domain-containing protein [Cellulomonadaceae bacterium]|jgi:metal-responsive CopG/Arc/MetJ family transcriptional regulator|nr:ribbon-helix-helix domain-containing protein [Cellulomonadaceae bacterium]